MASQSTDSFDQILAKGTASTATKDDLFNLGECYENGGDTKNFKNAAPTKDLTKALEYFLKASEAGHVTATRYAGYLYRQLAASGANNSFASNAVTLYTKAASAPMSDPRSMAVLGYFYEKGLTTLGGDVVSGNNSSAASSAASASAGVVVAPDAKQAAQWYQAAIASGKDDGTAAVNLALLYEKGKISGAALPTLEDKQKAFELFKSVADLPQCRNAAALINTGLYYEKGEKEGVVPKDMETALNKYYLRAAKLGDSTAYAIVGCCYETGQGCKVDYELAADFYVKGAMAGNNHAREGLRRLRDSGKI